MANKFPNMKSNLIDLISSMSSKIDKIMSDSKYVKYTSLVISVFIVSILILGGGWRSVLNVETKSGAVLSGIAVNTSINSDEYEVSGIPETVDAYIVGDLGTIQGVVATRNVKVGMDLSGLSEGTHNVKLVAISGVSGVQISLTPSNVNVVVRRKIEKTYEFSPMLINKSDSNDLSYGEPKFDTSLITIRASQENHDKIKFVRAIIDVNNSTSDYQGEAKLVAYDTNGDRLNVTITPQTLPTTVPISKPKKEVPVRITTTGSLPNATKAIDSIQISHSSVNLYGSAALLKETQNVRVTVPLFQIVENSTLKLPLLIPEGLTSMTSNVTVTLTLGEKTSKELDNVPIKVNNTTKYKVEIVDDTDKMTKLTVFGTKNQLDDLKTDSIQITPNLENIVEGEQVVPLIIEGPAQFSFLSAKQSIRIKATPLNN